MTSRSALCPCGSGLKYKRCHGSDYPPPADPEGAAWHRVRQSVDNHAPHLLRFVRKTYGSRGLEEAWADFHLGELPDGDEDVSWILQLFTSWLQGVWVPDRFAETTGLFPRGIRPVELYLQRNANTLDPIVREYLESMSRTWPSFWEILDCEPGRGFRIRDIMLGDEHFVFEKSASEKARKGFIFYGYLARANGVWLMDGSGGLLLAPGDKVEIIRLRERMLAAATHLSSEDLGNWELELRELYLHRAHRIMNPVLPHLTNTDGDDILWHTITYDIASADEASRVLRDLDEGTGDGEDDTDVERDESGAVVRAEVRWVRRDADGIGGASLGNIVIERNRLTAEVNSAERASSLREIIEQRLGKSAVHRGTETVDVRHELARRRAAGERPPSRDPEQEELMKRPEIQEQIRAMIARHYESWVDTALPALDGRTPREAVRDAAGREQVEALITDGELHAEPSEAGSAYMDAWARVRSELGFGAR
jgi:hypothetical protein